MDRQIKEYVVISEMGLDGINKTVNEYIQNGWTPIGGVSAVFINLTNPNTSEAQLIYDYSQALVR